MSCASLRAVTALAALLIPAAAWAADGSYEITNYYAGTSASGPGIGTHTLPVSPGTFGQTQVTGGTAPVVIALGQIASGDETFLRMEASYRYTITIVTSDPAALATLQSIIVSSDRSAVVGHLTGNFNMSGSSNSDNSVRLTASSEYGSNSMSASCDSGAYCSGPGSVTAGIDTPYSLTLHLYDFGFGCFGGGCAIGPNSHPFSTIEMIASAGVGYTSDVSGHSLGGSVYSMLDPQPSLDPDFFTSNGLDPKLFSLQVSTAAVPEPASWALMIVGMAMAGGLLRRRPRAALATAG